MKDRPKYKLIAIRIPNGNYLSDFGGPPLLSMVAEAVVNGAIAEGWQPLGGPTFRGATLFQAMVRSASADDEMQVDQMLSDMRPLADSRKPDSERE